MTYEVRTEIIFEAAHLIPKHPKCGSLHGHTWKVVVCLTGEELQPPYGFVADFGDVKKALRRLGYDHTYLNDLLDFIPTCEALACYTYNELKIELPNLMWVEVWEGNTNRARYSV